MPVKAVFGDTTSRVPLVCTLAAGTALVSVTGDSVGIIADKHGVVMFFRLVNHLVVGKGVEHITVNPALKHQLGEGPPHIAVGLREYERLLWFLFHRR